MRKGELSRHAFILFMVGLSGLIFSQRRGARGGKPTGGEAFFHEGHGLQ